MNQHRQQSRLHKRSFRWVIKVLLILVTAVLISTLFVLAKEYFSVKYITIVSPHTKNELRGYENFYQKLLPLVSEQEFKKNLIAQNPIVGNVEIQKIYPDRLNVVVKSLKPAVFIKAVEEYAILAANGRILRRETKKPNNLPEIQYYQQLFKEDLKVGSILAFEELQHAIRFINLLNRLGIRVAYVDINSFYMIRLVLEDSREILISTEKDIATQEYQISSILRQFRIDGTNFKRLDVRFDKPFMSK